ncbi:MULTISPECIES: SDR family NAD(P)-dependent oxidoreductase [Myxococcus]|uniref:Oxidoreductase n=1 Tax=Myxococcus xanthus TaxID=34 RepID=A0AAE6FWF6_MYXXA|nr:MULTISPECIES: SDR family oxidoreductase [Myxococcus]QDE66598.1 oxidoreductase [Myxococcus xanthus]QDE73871.1 oxidoreductase [Myxococcus xanthus]QDE81132.1 oxidoreductase [Myxococcus xanthus]QDE95464.1 oxidoreductase [Myxococcus xanthus]QDF02754.1 oxidoreductase [Myxococcus xanthus]
MKLAETAPTPAPEALPPPAPLSLDEVRRVTQLLEAISEDRFLLAGLPEEDRIAFLSAAGRVLHPDRDTKSRMAKALRRDRKKTKREHDRAIRATTEIRTLRRSAIFTVPALPPPPPSEAGPERILEQPRRCYVCKAEYRKLHFFYDAMCIECADYNYAKRTQRADLNGKVALITGARVKIGFQASLMLLRSGARVIATTRFPNDAAQRYVQEPDFADWAHRLHIHGLDLRHAPSVELFAKYIEQTHERLDILINNAAQTVRRPPGFYGHLLPGEMRRADDLPAAARALLAGHDACVSTVQPAALGAGKAGGSELATTWRSNDPALGIHSSAALSMLPYALEQEGDVRAIFPQGRLDADLQQVDLRDMNSWRLRLAEVQTAEMLEVHLINAVAPFILVGKLKPLMLRDRSSPGHVVNVSAMEGSFSRGTKTDKHPHTNMAKAALNMMTLTSAPDYARDNIYMNAVDTGWVTDEDPAQHAERKVQELDFQPPLDIVDGAARVVDPIIASENSGEYVWGNFFKDYRHTAW